MEVSEKNREVNAEQFDALCPLEGFSLLAKAWRRFEKHVPKKRGATKTGFSPTSGCTPRMPRRIHGR